MGIATEVPADPERTRALALAHLLGMGELGRVDPIAPGIAWLEEAIDEVPTDGQLRLWHAYMSYMDAWVCGDEAASSTALELL